MADLPGTLLAIAPVTMDLPLLLRLAIDAEQIGVSRLHLPAAVEEPARVVAALRDQTNLILSALTDSSAAQVVDLLSHRVLHDPVHFEFRLPGGTEARLLEFGFADSSDLPTMTSTIASGIGLGQPLPTSLAVSGESALIPSLAALAAGGHVCVGGVDDAHSGVTAVEVRTLVALAAKVGGIARLAGRPALTGVRARSVLGLV